MKISPIFVGLLFLSANLSLAHGSAQLQPVSPETQQPQATGSPGPQEAPRQPQLPPGFPLEPQMQTYIEQLLTFWEGTAAQVTHYQCAFTRWTFDHEICAVRNEANNHLRAAEISRGMIRYRSPDRGMYEVNEKWSFAGPPDQPGGEPKYERRSLTNKEYQEKEKWVCDGLAIYEYDYETQRLYEVKLPPEMQGQGLKNSPLPFVFGAKASDLLDRYWIRDVTPANVKDQYWLEAWPKRLEDAQTYSRLEIMLSREPFLPIAIHMYAANYDEKTHPSKVAFEFNERQINGTLAGLLDPFFIRPDTPWGWERIERDPAAEVNPATMSRAGDSGDANSPLR